MNKGKGTSACKNAAAEPSPAAKCVLDELGPQPAHLIELARQYGCGDEHVVLDKGGGRGRGSPPAWLVVGLMQVIHFSVS